MDSLPRTVLAALFIGLCVGALPAQAQRTSGAAGLGVQAGESSGVTLKIYNADGPSHDFLAAWSFDDFLFLNAHALFEQRLSARNVEQPVHWFIGPGAYVGVGIYDNAASSETGLGISGTVGLDILLAEQFELYIQVTPRFELVRETEPDIGGGLGLQYYF
jgi:hypothetical protein